MGASSEVLDAWLDAALKGNFKALAGGATGMSKVELQKLEESGWKAYESAATRAGWNKGHLADTPCD